MGVEDGLALLISSGLEDMVRGIEELGRGLDSLRAPCASKSDRKKKPGKRLKGSTYVVREAT